MLWLILLALVAVELFLCVLLVKLTALLPRWWLRWLAFVFGSFVLAALAAIAIGVGFAYIERYFQVWTDAFSPKPPYPTARLLLLTAVPALPLFYIIAGIVGLRRISVQEQLPLVRNWSGRRTLCGLGVACVALLGLFLVSDWLIRRQIRNYQAHARELALKVIAPPLQDAENSENAAPLYLASMPDGKRLSGQPGEMFPSDLQVLLQPAWTDYLTKNGELTEQIRAATRRPHCRFALDWPSSSILNDKSEYLSHLVRCSHLLRGEGHAALLKGDADRGYANAIALRALSDHMTRDPRPQSQLPGGAVSGHATSLLEHAFYVRAPTPDEFEQLQKQHLEFRERSQIAYSWSQAEIGALIPLVYVQPPPEQLPRDPPPGYSQVLAANLALWRFLFAQDDLAAFPTLFAKFQNQAGMNYVDGAAIDKGAHAQLTSFGWQFCESGGLLATKMMFMQRVALHACFEADANRRLTDAALQLFAANGKELLDAGNANALIGTADLPIDPFSTRPLKVLAADGGIVIYSVGPNQSDDGGEEEKGIPRNGDDDEVFCLGEAFKVRRLAAPAEETPAK